MSGDVSLKSKILVIDDSMLILKAVQEMLKDRYEVRLAQSAQVAFHNIIKGYIPDLILLDLEMPETDGYEILDQLKRSPELRDIPVIFLTGMDDHDKEEKALNMGAVDYILKPIAKGVLIKRIQMHIELIGYQKNLERLVDSKTRQLLHAYDRILDILANVTTYRDVDTGAHIIRTTNYSRLIVERLLEIQYRGYEITAQYAQNIIQSAKLHDIGKIAIPDGVLLKNGGLTPSEFEIIKQHTTIGAQMISHAANNIEGGEIFLTTAKEIILSHHEWWNGEGYPQQLKRCEIPISARVVAVADVYDALISKRPYKEPFPHSEAVNIIRAQAGTHFDIVLIDLINDLFPKFEEVAHRFRDE